MRIFCEPFSSFSNFSINVYFFEGAKEKDIFEKSTVYFHFVPTNLYSFSESEKKVFIDLISNQLEKGIG